MLPNTESSLKQLKSESVQTKPKFNIPPSKISVLSSETLAVLNNLNLNALKIQPKSSDDILNSVPAREKYQDLLDPVLKLSLPYKYKRLLQVQEFLDTTLNNARIRGLPRAFLNLKQAIECTYNINLDLDQVQRLIFLQPGFYKVEWKVENGESKLVLDLPEESSYSLSVLHGRSMVIREELLKRVKLFHKQHLEDLGISFDPDACKTWHSSFPLHDVPDVPLSELPTNFTDQPVNKLPVGNQLRTIRLFNLCKILVSIFTSHKIPSIFLKSLIKKILEAKSSDEDPKLIESDLIELSELFHTWLSIIKTESGEVVRMNKQIDFSLKQANKKLKEKYGIIELFN